MAAEGLLTGTVTFYGGESVHFVSGMAEMSRVEEMLGISFSDGIVSLTAMMAVAYFALKRTDGITVSFDEWRDTVAKVEADDDPESQAPPE